MGPSMPQAEIARKKAEIETLLAEYERDTAAAAAWYAQWKAKKSGFRCKREATS